MSKAFELLKPLDLVDDRPRIQKVQKLRTNRTAKAFHSAVRVCFLVCSKLVPAERNGQV